VSDDTLLAVERGGAVRCLYSDALADLLDEGETTVRRASRVEPAEGGGWTVDLSPVGGPARLGPFRLRGEALAAEAVWIERTVIGGGP